jgi:hypothetical protein
MWLNLDSFINNLVTIVALNYNGVKNVVINYNPTSAISITPDFGYYIVKDESSHVKETTPIVFLSFSCPLLPSSLDFKEYASYMGDIISDGSWNTRDIYSRAS